MLERAVLSWMSVPRTQQREALEGLLRDLPAPASDEEWNTRFGPQSLYDAWSRTTVARGVYQANRALLRPLLDQRPGWRAVEIGGGNGRLWRDLLRPDDQGELVLVDPTESAHESVAAVLPPGVKLVSVRAPVQESTLPQADAVVCSLTLHHVAGLDTEHRAAHGLAGPGKLEVLQAIRAAIRPRSGLALLNEADVYCEIDLPPGDPILADRIMDSYVRRTGLSLVDDLRAAQVDDWGLHQRWRAILWRWCLGQLEVVDKPLAERDVYELTVPRWLELLARAELRVEHHGFTDPYGLFCQYVLRAPTP